MTNQGESMDGGEEAATEVRLTVWLEETTIPLSMSTVKEIETAIAKLADAEFAELRAWLWDLEIERDAKAGRLDGLVNETISEYKAGRTKPL